MRRSSRSCATSGSRSGGADPIGANQKEFDDWCAVDSPAWTALEDGSATFDDIDTKVPGAIKVGTEPAPGSSAGS